MFRQAGAITDQAVVEAPRRGWAERMSAEDGQGDKSGVAVYSEGASLGGQAHCVSYRTLWKRNSTIDWRTDDGRQMKEWKSGYQKADSAAAVQLIP
jgi:hypothetical protein